MMGLNATPYFDEGNDSSSDSDLGYQEFSSCSQLGFVMLLKREQVLLNKSQGSSLKVAKHEAMDRFIQSFEQAYGRSISVNQVKKKINNMKMELKKKAIKNIPLKPWETELTKLITLEQRNKPQKKINDPQNIMRKKMHPETESSISIDDTDHTDGSPPPTPFLNSMMMSPIEAFETNETKNLSTAELQRLVLLEQLLLIREKRQKLRLDHSRLFSSSIEIQSTPDIPFPFIKRE